MVVDRWPLFRGSLRAKLLGRNLELSLLAGGCYSEVVVNTGLTVFLAQYFRIYSVTFKLISILYKYKIKSIFKYFCLKINITPPKSSEIQSFKKYFGV